VLVVDDSPTVRKLVTMTLEKNGFTVASAPDGVLALKSIAELKPRLILLDITMPRLGGYQLCKLIKKHESTKHIPVIMLSGKDGMFDKVRGKFVGRDDYITKPFDPDVLVEKVTTQLSEHYGIAGTRT
jgi:twitching motility two-component system response regulator PilG